jgi:hypothetical protein
LTVYYDDCYDETFSGVRCGDNYYLVTVGIGRGTFLGLPLFLLTTFLSAMSFNLLVAGLPLRLGDPTSALVI